MEGDDRGGADRVAGDLGASKRSATATSAPRKLRLSYLEPRPLGFNELPYHVDFGDGLGGELDVVDFVQAVLDEAKSWDIEQWRHTGSKSLDKQRKYAPVTQFAKDIGKNTWFGRVSRHEEKAPLRYAEFDYVLRRNHSWHEGQYTPEVVEVNSILKWDLEGGGKVEGWKDISMELVEMFHRLPMPLNKRVFTTLVLSGTRTDLQSSETSNTLEEFIVVQLPVSLTKFPPAVKQHSHVKPSKYVQGVYVSIERVAQIQGPLSNSNGDQSVKNRWTMATASDAKGVLPLWVQKKAVPDAIAKDVKFVTDYVQKNYGGEGWPEGSTKDR
ncbi:uncharacterized protein BDR25DRAFT_340335 [Lindgomyces ingoldianus]|uniref:Uncharacterized protein n=1 Tax=Lindgomyces ingoldianus TaxID=673940 RepID=A0ACB6R642_9PLEO|nr:uncharacterized protein BDR25DRAFT_340335 [Lindgomyces ingoldianus]KAF2474525.1 hypothetical protein BDR25DRAFT_340335 [Lindgomyces ingoldianus]